MQIKYQEKSQRQSAEKNAYRKTVNCVLISSKYKGHYLYSVHIYTFTAGQREEMQLPNQNSSQNKVNSWEKWDGERGAGTDQQRHCCLNISKTSSALLCIWLKAFLRTVFQDKVLLQRRKVAGYCMTFISSLRQHSWDDGQGIRETLLTVEDFWHRTSWWKQSCLSSTLITT